MVKGKDVPVWLKIITTVLSLIVAIWVGGWTASQIYSTNSGMVISHEKRVVQIEAELKLIDKRLDGLEKMSIKQDLGQKSLLLGQNDIKSQMIRVNDLMLKRIEIDAKLEQWLKSIDDHKDK